MSFLPWENLIYKTDLTETELRERINQNIEPKKTLRFGFKNKNTKPYEGYLNGNNFEINRIINYRNSFLPQIKGEITQANGVTRINVKMRMHIFVYIFLSIWCGGVGLVFVNFLISAIKSNNFEPSIFIPLGMLIFFYLMTTGGFKFESSKSKKDLEKILNSKING